MRSYFKSATLATIAMLSIALISCESSVNTGDPDSAPARLQTIANGNNGKNSQILTLQQVRTRQQSGSITITSGSQINQTINLTTLEAEMMVNPSDLSGDTLLAASAFTIISVKFHANGTPGPYTVPVSGAVFERIMIDKFEDGRYPPGK